MALVTDEEMAKTAALARVSMDGAVPGPAELASPSYHALESRSVIADGIFLKRMHPEMMPEFDLQSAVLLATQAGEVGAGPEVVWSDADTGAVAMRALTDGWRTANQAHLQQPGVIEAAMASIKALHGTAALPARFDAFAQIDALIGKLRERDALPDDIGWLRRLMAEAEFLLETGTLVPCRNDGSASNLMLGPKGEVLLVDFDRAGMNDPLYDVGCLLAETTDFESEMRAGFVAYTGRFDEAQFARARLWSYVDDMLHALWARLYARTSQRTKVEWLKYGEWRLIRLRMALRHPHYEEKVRVAGGAE